MQKKIKKVYLDYASSFYPNPSSIHALGVEAKKTLEKARTGVATYLGSRSSEIIFTGSGTEANNLAIQGVIGRPTFDKHNTIPHIVTTNIEHVSVLYTCQELSKRGAIELSVVEVDANGLVDAKKIREAIKENTVLVSVMYVNNEIGTILPIREIAKEIRHYNKKHNRRVLLHTDAVQAVGYLEMDVAKLGVDLLSISGAKLEGVGAGVGVLFKKENVNLTPILFGGGQERGLRSGTENLLLIERLGLKLSKSIGNEELRAKDISRIQKERDYFIQAIQKIAKKEKVDLLINADLKNRLPNNINITFPKIPSDLMLLELSARGVYVSEKSACQSGDEKNSYVIEALRKAEFGQVVHAGSLRFSLGFKTSHVDIKYALAQMAVVLKKLSKWYN